MTMSAPRSRAWSWRRWLVVVGTVVVLLLGSGFAVLRAKFEGEELGAFVASILNKRMRGRVEIGSISWETADLKKVLTGGWVPLVLRDVRVWDDCARGAGNTGTAAACTPDDQPDPDPASPRKPRKLLLRTPMITGEIDVHALMFGNHDFVFRNIWVHGGDVLLEQTREPYPLHAQDRTIMSLISAFYPRMRAGFRAGIYADSPPPVFDLRDLHIENVNLTVHMNPYTPRGGDADRVAYGATIRLEGVDVDADRAHRRDDSYLFMDGRDPLVAKLYVRLGVTARRGLVRVFDSGPRDAFRLPAPGDGEAPPVRRREADYEIELADIALDRLAQLPTEWPRKDYVANSLELDLRARTIPCATEDAPVPDPAAGATLRLSGEIHDYWDRPYDGAWNLAIDGTNLGPTIRTCIKRRLGGDQLDGRFTLTGPFVASPALGFDLRNLDVDVPLGGDEPLQLTLAEVHGRIDLVNEQGYVEKTTALVRGGREPGEVSLSATFGLRPYNAHASIEIAKAIDVGRFLPPRIATSVGRYLQGRLRANGDSTVGFALDEFDLSLGKTPKERAIRAHRGRLFTDDDFASLKIERVAIEAGRSRAVFDGSVTPREDLIDLTVNGDFPDLDVWLKRFGISPMVSSAHGGVIKIKGRLSAPKIDVVSLELGGVPCLDKVRIDDTSISPDRVVDARMASVGLGGELKGRLRMRMREGGAPPRIDKLAMSGRRIEAARLCGMKGVVKGTIDSLEVEVANTAIDPKRTSREWLEHAKLAARAERLSVLGDSYHGVALCLNRDDDQQCRPRTTYLDDDDLAQCAQAKRVAGGFCAVATATRDGGGIVDATVAKLPPPRGRPASEARLGGTVSLHDAPIRVIDALVGPNRAGGTASVTLHLQGTPDAPQATGAIQLLRAWVAGSFLGDAQLAVAPATMTHQGAKVAGLAITGSALAGRVKVSGTIGTAAPFPVELAVTGRRIELDVLMDLDKRLRLPQPVQAWVTGTVTVKTELAPTRPVEPEAWVELSELWGVYNHRSADGRRAPLTLTAHCRTDATGQCVLDREGSARTRVSMRVTPTTVELACKDPTAPGGRIKCGTKIATPAGVVHVQGHITPESMAFQANGTLDLALIAPLLDTSFDDVRGQADLLATISGTFERPRYEAALELRNLIARPRGGDTLLEAPSGLIKLANGSLGFTDVKVKVRDQHRDEAGEVHVKGSIGFDGLAPTTWSVLISGKLAGKMLTAALPSYVSAASGLARIDGDLMLTGTGPQPAISGTLVFDPLPRCPADAVREDGVWTTPDGDECRPPGEQPRAFAIIPRGLRRELAITRGTIDIDSTAAGDHRTYRITLNDLRTTIDGEGSLSAIRGRVELRDGELTRLDVGLNANDIPFRIPGTLDLVVSARNIRIEKASEQEELEIRGNVSIIDGTYQRNFTLTDQLIAIGAGGTPSKALWDEYPTIGNANLQLRLDVRRFAVANNIAQIDLDGPLIEITNTPRDPRLSGSIRVQRGTFRLPGTRARFTRTAGSIDFAENQRAGNPQLSLTSDALDYRDLSGQDHVITLALSGPLEQLQWDLRTSTGYNKSQTLALLVLGRNAEQLRRSLGDQALGADPTRVDPTTNPSTGFADQIVRDLAGDWVSGLLGDSLGQIIGLDVLRIEIGFGSIGLRAEKKVLENVKLIGDTEQTIRGNTLSIRGELKTPWKVTSGSSGITLQGGRLVKNFIDPAEQDIVDTSGSLRFVWLFVP